jgi:hypothetical protein
LNTRKMAVLAKRAMDGARGVGVGFGDGARESGGKRTSVGKLPWPSRCDQAGVNK